VSLFFHIIDTYDLFPHYRLHTPAEILKRNHATRWEVFRDVIIQQVVQTIFGALLAYFEPPSTFGREEYDVAVWAQRIRLAQRSVPVVLSLVGVNAGGIAKKLLGSQPGLAGVLAGGRYPRLQQLIDVNGQQMLAPAFAEWEMSLAKFVYWVGVPVCQFALAIIILDTWQYFLHRGMHLNQTLYSKFSTEELSSERTWMLTGVTSMASLAPPSALRSVRLWRAVQSPGRGLPP
jgi:sphinganine C4-monooxygenase